MSCAHTRVWRSHTRAIIFSIARPSVPGVKLGLSESRATMRSAIGLRAALCLAFSAFSVPAIAEDSAPAMIGGGVARPSVEELAVPLDENKSVAQKPAETERETDTREAMCLMIESAAKAQDLPLEFFARVIWQESRFQSDAIGPVTRNGLRAQGIAKLLPGSATKRRMSVQ